MGLIFGRKKSQPQSSPAPSEAIVSSFGPGAEFEGTLTAAAGTVCINSCFRGKAISDGTILIGETGNVEAELSARVITVAGKLKGLARASERFEIRARGVVLGDISTPVLLIEPGGFLEGQCHMPNPECGKEGTSDS